MKKLLIIGAALALAAGAHAQGYINFANGAAGVNAPVTNGVGGAPIAGNSFLCQLYYGQANSTEATLVALTNAPIGFSTVTPGYFTAGGRFLDPVFATGGVTNTFQVRVWEASLGSSWEQALATALSRPLSGEKLGKSNIIMTKAADGSVTPLPPPANLLGLRGFAVTPVPEPSTIAFGIMGLGALLLLRRRK